MLPADGVDRLTARQREILRAVCEFGREEAAPRLFVEPNSVKAELARIYRRMGLTDARRKMARIGQACWRLREDDERRKAIVANNRYVPRTKIPGPVEDKVWGALELVATLVTRRKLRRPAAPMARPNGNGLWVAGPARKGGTTLTLPYATMGDDFSIWYASENGSFFPASAFRP